MTIERFIEALSAFLARYGVFLFIFVFWIGVRVFYLRRWWRRGRELLDPALTPDWHDRRTSVLLQRVQGMRGGRRATLRRREASRRSDDRIVAWLECPHPGRFMLERNDGNFATRPLRFGAPPLLENVGPPEGVPFRVRGTDPAAVDRLLRDRDACDAIRACLAGPADFVELSEGFLRVDRRISRAQALALPVRESFAALDAAARALG